MFGMNSNTTTRVLLSPIAIALATKSVLRSASACARSTRASAAQLPRPIISIVANAVWRPAGDDTGDDDRERQDRQGEEDTRDGAEHGVRTAGERSRSAAAADREHQRDRRRADDQLEGQRGCGQHLREHVVSLAGGPERMRPRRWRVTAREHRQERAVAGGDEWPDHCDADDDPEQRDADTCALVPEEGCEPALHRSRNRTVPRLGRRLPLAMLGR